MQFASHVTFWKGRMMRQFNSVRDAHRPKAVVGKIAFSPYSVENGLRGFTLIELLVVIAIIALLLSVVLPGLRKAKMQARSLVCASNIRQLSLGMKVYATSNNGKIMPFGEANGKIWYHLVAPYLGGEQYANAASGVQNWEDIPAGKCPETKKSVDTQSWGAYGSANESWLYYGVEGSYGMNYWLIKEYPAGSVPANSAKFATETSCYFTGNYDTLRGDIPVLGDANWLGGWPGYLYHNGAQVKDKEMAPPDLKKGFVTELGFGQQLGRFCIDRHNMAVNIGFIDGSVNKLKLGNLWGLKWNKLYAPTDITIER